MEEKNDVSKEKTSVRFTEICIVQTICITVLLIGVLIIKFFFEKSYANFYKWYEINILDETVISEISDGETVNEN